MLPPLSAAPRAFLPAFKRVFSCSLETLGLSERRCVACSTPFRLHKGQLPLCPDCIRAMQPRQTGYCPLCGEIAEEPDSPPALCAACLKEAPPWQNMRFFGEYGGLLRELLHRAKYGGDAATLALLGAMLAQIAWDMQQADALVPLPLSASRLKQRGFNQCVEMGRAMLTALPMYKTVYAPIYASVRADNNLLCNNPPVLRLDLLTKYRATPSQTTLPRAQRLENLRGVFKASRQAQGLRILLLDDTSTTGATLREATRTLLRAGAASVQVIFVAHANAFAPQNPHADTFSRAFLNQGGLNNLRNTSPQDFRPTLSALWEKHV